MLTTVEPVFIPNHVDVMYAASKQKGSGESLPRPSYAASTREANDAKQNQASV